MARTSLLSCLCLPRAGITGKHQHVLKMILKCKCFNVFQNILRLQVSLSRTIQISKKAQFKNKQLLWVKPPSFFFFFPIEKVSNAKCDSQFYIAFQEVHVSNPFTNIPVSGRVVTHAYSRAVNTTSSMPTRAGDPASKFQKNKNFPIHR